jgi:hypothetical protein
VKTGLFGHNSVPEQNTKNMGNSPSFLSVTHMILSANGLEVAEFQRSTLLLISVSEQNSGWAEHNFRVSDWPKLQKYRISSW